MLKPMNVLLGSILVDVCMFADIDITPANARRELIHEGYPIEITVEEIKPVYTDREKAARLINDYYSPRYSHAGRVENDVFLQAKVNAKVALSRLFYAIDEMDGEDFYKLTKRG